MKRYHLILISLCLVFCLLGVLLTGCGKGHAGTWVATKAQVKDVDLEVADVFEEFKLVLDKDGSADMTVFGETSECSWEEKENGIILKNASGSLPLNDEDGALKTTYTGVDVTFEKK